MKLAFRDIEPFVKKPNPIARVILVYGPDDGLMRERARTMALSAVTDLNDPFNVAVLTGDALAADPGRLPDEANAISMMGGGRLVRIESATDKIATAVKLYLEDPSPHALVVIEAGELNARSPLRLLCEKSPKAAAVPCYVEDEQGLARFVRDALQAAKLRAEPDAVSWLASSISGDRGRARAEIEKLITYKGTETTPVTLADAQACCGDSGAREIEDLVLAVAGRQAGKALPIYNHLLSEGVSVIAILRALQNHFRRLHVTKAHIESGESSEAAMKSLNPQVFFKQESMFRAQLQNWSLRSIEKIMARLLDLEADCKKTATPAETLCAQAMLGIASMRG